MSGAPSSPVDAKAARRAKLELVVKAATPVWARAVLVIVGGVVIAHLAGVGEAADFALIPGIYMALGPPVGRLATRVVTVALAIVLLIGVVVLGAAVSGSTIALTAALVAIGFAIGLAPRFGPRWAALQLPLMTGFVYSAAFPTAVVSVGTRVVAVLAATPVYLVAAALLFQPDARRPMLLGAAQAFGALSKTLRELAAGDHGVGRDPEIDLVAFRVATGRLKDAALPLDDSLDSRAGRVLMMSVQQAVTATELLASEPSPPDEARRTRLAALADTASELGAALAGRAPSADHAEMAAPPTGAYDGDAGLSLLDDALASASSAVPVLQGRSTVLPDQLVIDLPGPMARLRGVLSPDDPTFRRAVRLAVAAAAAGLTASLLDLTRVYWAVFAVVVVLNAPAAQDWRRALMRIGGTVVGFGLALVLLALVGDHNALSLVIGLLLLYLAMLAMPVNYAVAVVFITATVAMMFAVSGEEADFLRYRVVDNLVGVAIVCGVGLLLWRTSRADWWHAAAMTAGTLAESAAADEPIRWRDALATRLLQLRTETVEAAALPDATPAFAPTWTYLAAAEDLTRAIVGPRVDHHPPENAPSLAAHLRVIEQRCSTDGSVGDDHVPSAVIQPATRTALDVARMADAVTLLHHAERGA
jgi:uncharacterized membrane protein YccC